MLEPGENTANTYVLVLELVRLSVLPPGIKIFVVLESSPELAYINLIGDKHNFMPEISLDDDFTYFAVTQKLFHTFHVGSPLFLPSAGTLACNKPHTGVQVDCFLAFDVCIALFSRPQ